MLSADSTEDRKVEALEAGADDYVTKPFGMRELNARLRVALRHRATESGDGPTELQTGPLHLDLVHYGATFDGRDLELTSREFEFLAYLARNAGKVCTRRMILENVWGPGYGERAELPQGLRLPDQAQAERRGRRFLQSDPSIGYRLAWRGV